MLWPATLLISGFGMFIVSYVQPTEKALHLVLAMLLVTGGVTEARYRLGQISRATADSFVIPALIVGGFVIGPLHANGALTSSIAAQTHMLTGIMGWVLAGVRLTQVRYGSTAALDTTFGIGVIALGLSLLLVEQLHHH